MIGISSWPFLILGATMQYIGLRMVMSANRELRRIRRLKKMQKYNN